VFCYWCLWHLVLWPSLAEARFCEMIMICITIASLYINSDTEFEYIIFCAYFMYATWKSTLSLMYVFSVMPSVLWHCWFGSSKGMQPVKNWVVGCWRGCVPGSRCRFAYGPADGTATHYLLLQLIQIGFTFLVPAHLGVCVCVCVLSVYVFLLCWNEPWVLLFNAVLCLVFSFLWLIILRLNLCIFTAEILTQSW